MRTKVLTLLVMLAAPVGVMSQSGVYKAIDENGNVIFTDTPPAASQSTEKVDIPPINRAAPPPNIPRRESNEPKTTAISTEIAVSITSPANDATIPLGPGNFDVVSQVTPELQQGQQVQLMMDEAAWGDPQTETAWSMVNVFNGSHTLLVNVLDEQGAVIATSEPVTVHVVRTTGPGNMRVWQAGQDADGNWLLNPGSVRGRTVR